MLSISKNCRYFVYAAGTDMRCGFDSLSGLVREQFEQEPLSGDIFIFLNKPRNRIKLLHWQGDGFAIFYKRLEKGTFELPPTDKNTIEITPQQLLLIMEGIHLSSIKKRPRFSAQKT